MNCECEKTMCLYCELVYCPECVRIDCQVCINNDNGSMVEPDSMACPNCAKTENILDTLICHQCFYYMLKSGQLSYCLDCDDYMIVESEEHIIFDIESKFFMVTANLHETHRIIYGPEQKDIMVSSTLNKFPQMKFNKKLAWNLDKLAF